MIPDFWGCFIFRCDPFVDTTTHPSFKRSLKSSEHFIFDLTKVNNYLPKVNLKIKTKDKSRSPALRDKLREDPEPKPRAQRRGSVGAKDKRLRAQSAGRRAKTRQGTKVQSSRFKVEVSR